MLGDADLTVLYASPGPARDAASSALKQARTAYDALVAGDLFRCGRQLRNGAIAHLLRTQKPTVEYEAIYHLQKDAIRLWVEDSLDFWARSPSSTSTQRCFGTPISLEWLNDRISKAGQDVQSRVISNGDTRLVCLVETSI